MINAGRAAARVWGRARPWRPRAGRGAGRLGRGPGSLQATASLDGVHACPLPWLFPCRFAPSVREDAPRIRQSSPAPPEGSTCSGRHPCPVFEDAGRGFPAAVGSGPLRPGHHCLRPPIAATPRALGGPAPGHLRGRGAVTARVRILSAQARVPRAPHTQQLSRDRLTEAWPGEQTANTDALSPTPPRNQQWVGIMGLDPHRENGMH